MLKIVNKEAIEACINILTQASSLQANYPLDHYKRYYLPFKKELQLYIKSRHVTFMQLVCQDIW